MNWAELNADLLRLIFRKLGELFYFIRFCSVCKNWRSSVLLHDHPKHLPWFVEFKPILSNSPPPSQLGWFFNVVRRILPETWLKPSSDHKNFFSLLSKRSLTFYIPQAKGTIALHLPYRYVSIYDYQNRTTSLVNPITGSRFCIPQIYVHDFDRVHHDLAHVHQYPVYIGPNSSPNGKGDIAIICVEDKQDVSVYLWRLDDTMLKLVVQIFLTNKCTMTYYKGRLFYYDWKRMSINGDDNRKVSVLDVSTGDKFFIVSEQNKRFDFLIDGGDDLLGVINKCTWQDPEFEVYRLDNNVMYNPRWVKMINGVGDRMLFVGRSDPGICLNASDFDGYTGNCIYFMRKNNKIASDMKHDLARYDLQSNKTQLLPFSVDYSGLWFVPSL